MVTLYQMNAWNRVSVMAAKRKIERARMEAVAKILAERKTSSGHVSQGDIFADGLTGLKG